MAIVTHDTTPPDKLRAFDDPVKAAFAADETWREMHLHMWNVMPQPSIFIFFNPKMDRFGFLIADEQSAANYFTHFGLQLVIRISLPGWKEIRFDGRGNSPG